ncbi:hypothetical protein CROQUDRAFT_650807 [Cronartium quercuum f. sp. fusiforme G11]|uniref:Golgi apparatus membrane protein TVP38 n=1 Tax=Cronartium quercuum f. sp. fusiforme G11 TaxID=708437 RepID=A0A9P6NT55_9BASI|nr:hypothetical protein CROQUDRAFT_650807 [Cronartium quercuum f. sp. fusiforme G11]
MPWTPPSPALGQHQYLPQSHPAYGPPPAFESSITADYPPGPKISELADSFTSSQSQSVVKRQTSFRDKQWDSAFGPLSINTFLRKDWIKYYIILILLLIAVAIVTIFHHQIIVALKPFADDLRDLKVSGFEIGWIIPIAILFVISFPPLFGHEIIIILCGLVWGLWIGFAIVSVGTFLGEVANYWTFKYACTNRAKKLERKDLNYACMCIVVREGGFWIAFLARLSAIPGHLVTPVFATTGMSLWIFSTATLLSMPKQLAGVYLGTLFNVEADTKPTSSKVVEYVVLTISFLVTLAAALYIYKKMAKSRPIVQARWATDAVPVGEHHIEPYYGPGPPHGNLTPSANSSPHPGFSSKEVDTGNDLDLLTELNPHHTSSHPSLPIYDTYAPPPTRPNDTYHPHEIFYQSTNDLYDSNRFNQNHAPYPSHNSYHPTRVG